MSVLGVLWDLDGILVDTGEFHYRAWFDTLQLYNISYSREAFRETFGMNNRGVLGKLLGQEPEPAFLDIVSDKKEKLFRELIQGKVRPLPGVIETLKFFRSRGIRQAVASSAPPENIEALLDALNLRGNFEAVVSGFNLNGKPAPDVFLAAAKAIGIPPQNCLVIEDAVTGVEGAIRAGMLCLAVTNTNTAENLKQADYVVDSLLDITEKFLVELIGVGPKSENIAGEI